MMTIAFTKADIDYQVMSLLPNTLLLLNEPFMYFLKTDNGLQLLRYIDFKCLENFV
jgi:hypothetical protein